MYNHVVRTLLRKLRISYVKKMLNKLYNLFAKNGFVLKLRFKEFLKRNI
jgi:hypothetical protein